MWWIVLSVVIQIRKYEDEQGEKYHSTKDHPQPSMNKPTSTTKSSSSTSQSHLVNNDEDERSPGVDCDHESREKHADIDAGTFTIKKKSHRNLPAAPFSIDTLEDLVPNRQPSTDHHRSISLPSASVSNDPPQQSSPLQQRKKKSHGHTWLYVLLHPHSTHPHAIWYKWFISIIIVVDVAFFVASTEEAWSNAHPDLFYYEEGLVSSIFLLEYFCRLVVAPESHKYSGMKDWQARLHYMGTVSAMVDAASSLPFFLELPTGLALPNLTWIRFFRLLRILKTGSYARSMETVWRVIYYNREILYVALNMCILLVLVTAVLMYYCRPKDDMDNVNFNSLLSTMYLSTLMLTGQGGPDGE